MVSAPRLTLSQPHQSNHPPSSPQGKHAKAKNKTVKVKRASKTRHPDLLFAKGWGFAPQFLTHKAGQTVMEQWLRTAADAAEP